INGSQLYFVADTVGNLANSVKTKLGGNTALAPNGTITMTNIGGTGQNTIHDAIAFVNAKQGGAAVNVVQGDGITVTNATVNGGKTFTVGLSDATKANITKAQTDATKGIADAAAAQANATKAIADAKAADNKAVAAQNTANTAVTKADAAQATADKAAADIKALDDIAVKYDSTAKDTVTLGGADGTTITNVKDGAITADSKDAVNGSQLYATNQQVINNVNNIAKLGGNVQSLNRRVDNLADNVKKNKKRNDAGIASTAAMANIPQVMLAGKSGVGVGVGHRSGQNAIAVGYSRASDNAKHIIKLSAGLDTQSKATFGAGYMYQW
ncbi:MAG: YadA-like family protein, partial [Actinobacillus porcinus]|uniref:YadA-like family protein n=1 Tax=Actinobacillus porcinus TaxID=51048 RepID=UPI00235411ED